MEYFGIKQTSEGLHIEGFPDAIKVVRLSDPKANRLADIALHKADLEFAAACLEEINKVTPESLVIRQSLWQCAIVHFMKCFGNDARFQLSEKKIWKGNSLALTVFEFFKDLRNKHLVHDENSYAQSLPGAILNKGDKPYKIEKIVCLSALAETLEQDNYSNLHALIQTSKIWVTKEFDELCDSITKDLEVEPFDKLITKEAITLTVPTIEEISKKRAR